MKDLRIRIEGVTEPQHFIHLGRAMKCFEPLTSEKVYGKVHHFVIQLTFNPMLLGEAGLMNGFALIRS